MCIHSVNEVIEDWAKCLLLMKNAVHLWGSVKLVYGILGIGRKSIWSLPLKSTATHYNLLLKHI